MQKHIPCAMCRFAQADETYSDNMIDQILFGDDCEDESCCEDDWTAYECDNRQSRYYRSLLNVSPEGDKLPFVAWAGCKHGERTVAA